MDSCDGDEDVVVGCVAVTVVVTECCPDNGDAVEESDGCGCCTVNLAG